LSLDDNSQIQIATANGNNFSFNGVNMTDLIAKAPLGKEADQIANLSRCSIAVVRYDQSDFGD